MKKAPLLNAELSYIIAKLGHQDQLCIGDAGLPIPDSCQRLDLALTKGIPSFIDTVKAVLGEMQIEAVTLAEETLSHSPQLHAQLLQLIQQQEQLSGQSIRLNLLSHETFKQQTASANAVVRTGEFTPYANVIFHAGVVF
ncbi:D-ribose pyranase [Agarivorans sp. QJM3NY_29]|uniref:D-ribose pyranase n=1 Tax=unclassified Agarivorans TaxID=2636026 RepID=UPI003D7D05C0